MHSHYERQFVIIGGLACWALGAMFDVGFLLLSVFLLTFIFVFLSRLSKLYMWALGDDMSYPPFESGILGELCDYVIRGKQKQKRQEERVNAQLERFRKIISMFPDGVIILSLQNEVQWFNSVAAEFCGLKKVDKGEMIQHIVRHPKFTTYVKQKETTAVLVIDRPTPMSVGAEKIEIRMLPYGSDEKLMIIRDVTRTEKVLQMRKDFISNASHELRTPLTVMKGYIEMLQTTEQALPETLQKPVQKVDQQVQKMQNMIEELLLLSKLEESGLASEATVINIGELFESVAIELKGLAEQHQQTLKFERVDNVNLKGNQASILTVLRNLIANAVHYSHAPGKIIVRWEIKGGQGVISVTDEGKGIAQRHLERLTERFYRVPENSAMHKGGTGLGLAIVKHELDRHQAQLEISSQVGTGSTFSCSFPADRTA